jgi:hypothetical protein
LQRYVAGCRVRLLCSNLGYVPGQRHSTFRRLVSALQRELGRGTRPAVKMAAPRSIHKAPRGQVRSPGAFVYFAPCSFLRPLPVNQLQDESSLTDVWDAVVSTLHASLPIAASTDQASHRLAAHSKASYHPSKLN